MLKQALSAAFLLAFLGPAFADPAKLGHNPVLSGGEYSTGGGLTVALEPRAINGRIGLCGVWAQSDPMPVYTRRAAPSVLTKGIVMIDDQIVLRNLNFLKRTRPAPTYAGAPSGCTILNRAWPGDLRHRISVRIPRQKIVATSASRSESGPRVVFTRSDSTNPALKKGSLVPSYITSRSSSGSH